MTKSLLAGIATWTALAVFAGNADAYTAHAHHTRRTMTTSAPGSHGGSASDGTRSRTRVNTRRNDGADPIYDSCEFPWRHPGVGCPYGR